MVDWKLAIQRFDSLIDFLDLLVQTGELHEFNCQQIKGLLSEYMECFE